MNVTSMNLIFYSISGIISTNCLGLPRQECVWHHILKILKSWETRHLQWESSCYIWAATSQNQQRLRSAWAATQSDQSLLCPQRVAMDPMSLHAASKDSDKTGWMARLNGVFAGCTSHSVGFVMSWLISKKLHHRNLKVHMLSILKTDKQHSPVSLCVIGQ